ncbi:serine/threonine-protein kinase [Streptomyces virginiae]|uniref:serine/threonine-protein kinase n=1 Tax=Streptomyces virginiae TaxID=1961 RepID=UPI00367B8D27
MALESRRRQCDVRLLLHPLSQGNASMPAASSSRSWSLPGFQTIDTLGAGASGEVVEAVGRAGTPVAIKYLSPEFRSDSAQLARFREEARVLQQLTSPHVARLYEYQEHSEGAAIVMELVRGASLAAVLREEAPLTPEAALWLLKGSLRGLSAAHAAGIVHRDYKPANVLITLDGTSKLVDFGIAVRQGADASCTGTPAYMAPEQWHGGPPSPATDVYAAAATFFECLTGERPFHGSSMHELAVQHTTSPIPFDLAPEPVRPLLAQGLAKAPEDRPADADCFLASLEKAATASYGPDWEDRGKRVLAALAALTPLAWPTRPSSGSDSDAAITALPSPQKSANIGDASRSLKKAGAGTTFRSPHETGAVERGKLWSTAAAGLAAVAALGAVVAMVTAPDAPDPSSRAASPASSGTVDTTPTEPDDSSQSGHASRGTKEDKGETGAPEEAAIGVAVSGAVDGTSSGTASSGPTMSSTVSTHGPHSTASPSQSESSGGVSSSSSASTGETLAPPPVQHVGVTGLSADSSRKATATLIVWTGGTGPVKLTVRWYDASAISDAANPGRQEGSAHILTLTGRTRYTVSLTHVFDLENCSPHWGILASTSPTAVQARPYRTVPALPCRGAAS